MNTTWKLKMMILLVICAVFCSIAAAGDVYHRTVIQKTETKEIILFGLPPELPEKVKEGIIANPSYQLLRDRGLAMLYGKLIVYEKEKVNSPLTRLTVYNLSMHSLKLDLNGKNGRYRLEVGPRANQTWSINNGEYHFEIGVPGLPSAEGELDGEAELQAGTRYDFQIGRTEPY